MSDLNVTKFYTQKVLPLIYDESLSYYEMLCKMVDVVNQIIKNESDYEEWFNEFQITAGQLQSDIIAIKQELNKIKGGHYISNYISALSMWVDENLQNLVGKIAKFVQFGITNDGYFYADIPDNWDFLTFDTVVDSTNENYGCLVIKY